MDAGSKIFKDKTISIFGTSFINGPIVKEFASEIDRAAKAYGVNLNPDEINGIIRDTYNSAKLERGFKKLQEFSLLSNSFDFSLNEEINLDFEITQKEKNIFKKTLVKNLDEGKNLSRNRTDGRSKVLTRW